MRQRKESKWGAGRISVLICVTAAVVAFWIWRPANINWELLEHFVVSIAWPLVFLSIVIVFRPQIERLMRRGWRIKHGEMEAEIFPEISSDTISEVLEEGQQGKLSNEQIASQVQDLILSNAEKRLLAALVAESPQMLELGLYKRRNYQVAKKSLMRRRLVVRHPAANRFALTIRGAAAFARIAKNVQEQFEESSSNQNGTHEKMVES